ncbi:FAD:protein FMN transferase [Streptomyces sp. CA2R106]|uniref:FAD:protein FMN transferase n=1 Tax=Streptomyces sp. CA2R106 TaxID=3120153 RepID=UPI00300B0236
MRTVREGVLGARVSIAAPDSADFGTFQAAGRAAFALLRRIEDVFCAPRPGGSARRVFEGLLGAADLGGPPEAGESREALDLCAMLRAVGEGVFDALDTTGAWDASGYVGAPAGARTPGGRRLDPRKAVRCWAVERASDLLAARGLPRHLVNAGGDLRLRSDGGTGPAWRVRLADPGLTGGLLAMLEVREGALATCAATGHDLPVRMPGTGRPAAALTQVTVIGPDLARADLYATAATAQPTTDRARAWVDGLAASTPYEALCVDSRGRLHTTAGLAGRLRLEAEPLPEQPDRPPLRPPTRTVRQRRPGPPPPAPACPPPPAAPYGGPAPRPGTAPDAPPDTSLDPPPDTPSGSRSEPGGSGRPTG